MTTLNIGGGGAMKPIAKYNAKADKWFIKKGKDSDVEIGRPTFMADFANIATGWLAFKEGQAPQRVIDPSLQQAAPNPGEPFKRGFVLNVFSPKFFGGLAEISTTSLHMGNAVKDVYVQWEKDVGAQPPGSIAVITCTGSLAMKDKMGTNYRPQLSITSWAPRPAELPDVSAVGEVPLRAPAQPAEVTPTPGMPDDDIPF